MAIPEKLRIRINLIAFLVISAVLIYLMATQVLTLLQGRDSVNAIFTDAGGVFTNQEVTYRGTTVGQVGEMRVVPEGVKIELIIKDEYQIPKEGIEARVMFKSAVGEQFVDLLPASSNEPYLEDGDEIPLDQTSIPVSTQALLSTTQSVLEGVPPESLAGAINSLAEGLAGNGSDIALMLESLADLSDLFAQRAPEVVGILRDGTTVGDAFLKSRTDFANAIRDLINVADLLADNRPTIERLLNGANLLSDELVRLLQENRDVLNRVIIELADINAFQAAKAEDINELIHKLPIALQNVVKTFENKTGLVRFGLVQDDANHACNYKIPEGYEREPENRTPKLPRKFLTCIGTGENNSGASTSDGSDTGSIEESTTDGAVPAPDDMLLPDTPDAGTRLPEHMEDMGWMFFYLNGLR